MLICINNTIQVYINYKYVRTYIFLYYIFCTLISKKTYKNIFSLFNTDLKINYYK